MRRGPQPNELRRQFDGPVVLVLRHVAKRNLDAQGMSHSYYCLEMRIFQARPGPTQLNVFVRR